MGLALAVGMSVPTAAGAATIGGGEHALQYTAEGSEQNDVTVAYDSASNNYTLTDTGVAAISDPFNLCSVVGNVASCSGLTTAPFGGVNLDAWLGEGDDRFTILGAHGNVKLFVEGGAGSDRIDASRIDTTIGGALLGDGYLPAPNPGDDVVHAGDSSQDGFDVRGGGGADQLFGGSGDDLLLDFYPTLGTTPGEYIIDTVGEPDLLDGGGGDDQLDAGNGADISRGGAGRDNLTLGQGWLILIEPGRYLESIDDGFVDSNSCGPGDDQMVVVGPRDTVTADCEVITQSTTCPEGAPGPCANTLIASAPAPAGAAGARAAKSRPRVRLTKPRTIQVGRGKLKAVTLRFRRKGKRRALKGRSKVRARVVARRKSRTRRLRSQRTPFLLKRR